MSIIILVLFSIVQLISLKMFEKKRNQIFVFATDFLIILMFVFLAYIMYMTGNITAVNLISIFISGSLIIIIRLIYLIINHYNQVNIKSQILWIVVLIVFAVFDRGILQYDALQFRISYYSPSIELGEDTNIYMLGVGQEYATDEVELKKSRKIYKVLKVNNVNNLEKFTLCSQCLMNRSEATPLEQSITIVEKYLGKETKGLKYIKNRKNLSGNSAGLALVMSGLVELNKLNNIHSIAITGAVDSQSNVTEIGSVEEKVQIASMDHREFMIVPKDNYSAAINTAKKLNLNIKIFSVSTIVNAKI